MGDVIFLDLTETDHAVAQTLPVTLRQALHNAKTLTLRQALQLLSALPRLCLTTLKVSLICLLLLIQTASKMQSTKKKQDGRPFRCVPS